MEARTITEYVAKDGAVFRDRNECILHEELVDELEVIMSKLPPKPDDPDCRFANGHGYIQHDKETFIEAKNDILQLILSLVNNENIKKNWITPTIEQKWGECHPSWVSKAVSDCCPRIVNSAWRRFSCTDKEFREWGQPYFADNPDKGTLERLN